MISDALAATLFLAGAAIGVARTQPFLAKSAYDAKERGDVYVLPPPVELHAATLGWDSASVDLLWSSLLIEYGTHWAEHRDYADVPKYVDAILELEPTFPLVYKYVDTMLAYRPIQGTEADVRLARAYLERGTRERPNDAALWTEYGQFIAFVAPSFLANKTEGEAWRREGAAAIGHAVELGADADRALAAATMLNQAGERDAAIRYLERAYAFTEHPSMTELHQAIGRKLASLQATALRDADDEAAAAIDARWKAELPFVSREQYLLLGPTIDPLPCAGIGGFGGDACERPECCQDWASIVEK